MVVQKLHDPRKQVAIAQTKALVPPLSVKGVAYKTTKAPCRTEVHSTTQIHASRIHQGKSCLWLHLFFSFWHLTFSVAAQWNNLECISIMIKLHFSKAQFKCKAGEVLSSKLVEKGTLYTLLPVRQAGTLTNHELHWLKELCTKYLHSVAEVSQCNGSKRWGIEYRVIMPLSSLFRGKPLFFYLMGGIYLTETIIRHCPHLQIYLLHVIHVITVWFTVYYPPHL